MGIKCELYHDNFQNFKRYNFDDLQSYEQMVMG